MNVILPNASKSDGTPRASGYPAGRYIMKIDTASWNASKEHSSCYNSIDLACTIIDAPVTGLIGKKYKQSLMIPTENHKSFDGWYDNAIAKVVNLCNALQLKVVNDSIPLDSFADKTVGATMASRKYTDKKTGEEKVSSEITTFFVDKDA